MFNIHSRGTELDVSIQMIPLGTIIASIMHDDTSARAKKGQRRVIMFAYGRCFPEIWVCVHFSGDL